MRLKLAEGVSIKGRKLPASFYIVAIATISRYPISRARLERLRTAFDRRAARQME